MGNFKRVVAGTSGGAAGMVHPGSGFVTVFIAQDSGAVAKIHILQVGKVDFVQ